MAEAQLSRLMFSVRRTCISGRNKPLLSSRITADPTFRLITTSAPSQVESRQLGKVEARGETQSFDNLVAQEKDKQARTPWHRQDSNLPPVKRPRSAGAMTKGKLLTTPSRLLKLIIPLTTLDHNSDRKDVQPLALLVHPQQPLSYLERLIQSELPTIQARDGTQKIPAVHFKAEDFASDEIKPARAQNTVGEQTREKGSDAISFDGKIEHTGKIDSESDQPQEATQQSSAHAKEAQSAHEKAHELRGGPGEGGVEFYSGSGREGESRPGESHEFVRWSTSTEIGDFIRDAARGKEFAVEIEGAEREVRVGVPSFGDRTHYLRTRLRKASKRISVMAAIKLKCDHQAHKSAEWVAVCGFGGLVGWWGLVYYLTFKTDLGWDVMEPVTYLVGLSTLMGGYLWFLYHNREVSYRSALNLTVSRRQNQLYQAKGFDLNRWEALVQEANALRQDIKKVADEYDVEWDERQDEHDENVTQALKEDRESKKNKEKDEEDEDQKKE